MEQTGTVRKALTSDGGKILDVTHAPIGQDELAAAEIPRDLTLSDAVD